MREVLNGTQTFLDHLKATWLPELQQLVAKINENFRCGSSHLCLNGEALQCAKGVLLQACEGKDGDFSAKEQERYMIGLQKLIVTSTQIMVRALSVTYLIFSSQLNRRFCCKQCGRAISSIPI